MTRIHPHNITIQYIARLFGLPAECGLPTERSVMGPDLLKEVGDLQNQYQSLVDKGKLTKKAMCDLVIPFRDKYKLTDIQALQIARAELSIKEISDILSKE